MTIHRTFRGVAAALAIAVASLVAAAAPASAAVTDPHCRYDRSYNACLHLTGTPFFFHWDAHVGIDVHLPAQYGREILDCGADFRASLWGDDGNLQFIRNLQLKPGWPAAGPTGIGAEFIGQTMRPTELNEDGDRDEDELVARVSFYDCHTGITRDFLTGIVRGEFRA